MRGRGTRSDDGDNDDDDNAMRMTDNRQNRRTNNAAMNKT